MSRIGKVVPKIPIGAWFLKLWKWRRPSLETHVHQFRDICLNSEHGIAILINLTEEEDGPMSHLVMIRYPGKAPEIWFQDEKHLEVEQNLLL